MSLGIERLRRIMDNERRGMLIDGPAERIAEAAYQQGARDMRERCAKAVAAEELVGHTYTESDIAYGVAIAHAVAAIRALKDGEEC